MLFRKRHSVQLASQTTKISHLITSQTLKIRHLNPLRSFSQNFFMSFLSHFAIFLLFVVSWHLICSWLQQRLSITRPVFSSFSTSILLSFFSSLCHCFLPAKYKKKCRGFVTYRWAYNVIDSHFKSLIEFYCVQLGENWNKNTWICDGGVIN